MSESKEKILEVIELETCFDTEAGRVQVLDKVSFDDRIMKHQTMTALGDAYVETDNLEKGLDLYKEAARGLADFYGGPPGRDFQDQPNHP